MKQNNTGRSFLPKSLALLSVLFLSLSVGKAMAQTQAGWDVSGLSGYGASPLTASTAGSNLTIGGLTRGSGVTTSGTAAASAWGGANWVDASEATAITNGRYAKFTIKANTGYKASVDSLKLAYRRSATGATNGELQYSLDGTTFTDIQAFSYSSTSTSGATLPTVDLHSVTALHNVNSCTTITFRIVNWGGTGSAGTWYVFDKLTGNDLIVYGTNAAVAPTHLAVTSISPASPAAGVGFDVTVQSQDVTNTASNATVNTPFTLTTNGAAGAISGTTTGTVAGGSSSVTVTGVVLASAGTGATITATRTSGDCLTAGTSSTFTVTAGPCSGAPGAGTISTGPSSFCGSGSTTLTLAPASGGTGLTYQWLSSTTGTGGPWTVITGETNLTYTTPVLSATTYYACVTTCTNSGISDTTLPGTTITINPYPVLGPITGTTTTTEGGTTTLSNSTSGGVWSSSNTSVATIGTAGDVTGVTIGSTVITYTVTSGAGCTSFVTTTVFVDYAAYTTGNLVVVRENGTTSASNSVTLVEYDKVTANQPTPVTSNTLPFAGTGHIVQSGSATSEGHLALDAEHTHLVLVGYDANVGVASIATVADINRVVYSVLQTGVPTEVSNVPQSNAFSGSNIRSATANGSDYFAAGTGTTATSGIQLMGTSTSLQTCTTTPNSRVAQIFNGQLYYSTGSTAGGPIGIYAVGTGIPTTLTDATNVIATGSSTSPYGFSISPDGNTAYIADDASSTTKGVQKWTLSGGVWTMAYRLASNAGARSVAVDYSTNPYTVYATTASGSATVRDTLIKIVDSNASAVYLKLATSPSGTSFRGVTFVPSCDVKIYAIGNTTFCSGDSTKLVFYGNPGATVVYNDGSANDTIVLNSGGTDTVNTHALTASGSPATYTYSLVSITTSICDATSVSGSVFITVNPVPSISGMSDVVLCVGDLTSVPATPTGGTWASSDVSVAAVGTSDGIITGVAAGSATITYTVISEEGCTASATLTATVAPLPVVDPITGTTTVCADGTTTLSDATADGTWGSNDPSIATVDAFGVVTAGSTPGTAEIQYAVSDDLGCTTIVTTTVTVITCENKHAGNTATVINGSKTIEVYPNPASDVLHISAPVAVNAVIIAMDGKVVITQNNASNINISNLADGIYVVKIYDEKNALLKTVKLNKTK